MPGIVLSIAMFLWTFSTIMTSPRSTPSLLEMSQRPHYLVHNMTDSPLKLELAMCLGKPAITHDLAIGHRGAPLHFPEHTKESYEAAIAMGAGIVECDVTFTKDKHLVCRHAQCDLHRTTNILSTPLSQKCRVPPKLDGERLLNAADITCCTTDVDLGEFLSLRGKMDHANVTAQTLDAYMAASNDCPTQSYVSNGTLLTHKDSIKIFKNAKVKMTPELKCAEVDMPYEGMTQRQYAQKMIAEYLEAGIDPTNVFAQSFSSIDIFYWQESAPQFAEQAVFLDDRYDNQTFDENVPHSWYPSMKAIADSGIKIIAPPIWVLLKLPESGNRPVPSAYAIEAKKAGLDIITWSLERSCSLVEGGGWYYKSIEEIIHKDGDTYTILDVLVRDIGVKGVFSDWPATVSFYANCIKNITGS